MIELGVNIDHVATLREARKIAEPDPAAAAIIAELAGAMGITMHLREDRRHVQERDVEVVRNVVKTRLNLEMAATEEMVAKAIEYRVDLVTLVPEGREEITTEGGLDVAGHADLIRRVVRELAEEGIPTSLFIDPDPAQLEEARAVEAPMVELHTGEYANATGEADEQAELERLIEGAALARSLGLRVNAGHGLNYRNVVPIAAIEGMEELNIGHAIVSHAVFVGFERAVKEMVALIKEGVQRSVTEGERRR